MPAPVAWRVRAYVVCVSLLAAGCALALLAAGYRVDEPWLVAALAGLAVLAERTSIGFSSTFVMSTSMLPTLFAAVVLGPLEAGIVYAASMLGDRELRNPSQSRPDSRLRWLTYTSTSFVEGAAMGLVAFAVIDVVDSEVGGLMAATLLAALVGEGLDLGAALLTLRIRGREVGTAYRTYVAVAITSVPAYAPVVAVVAIAYTIVSPWTALLFVVPALVAHQLYALYLRQRELASELSHANETLARANLAFAGALVAALDARDEYTAGHSAAVAIYSRDIAQRMGLSAETVERIYLCGLVHDIGKILLPPEILTKPGALTLDERRQMEKHSEIGEGILRKVEGYDDVAMVVRHHHERVDGHGYPDRLSGDEIPLLSRIIGVADAYNAMTSDRPYRDAMPSRVARMRLAQAVGSQFDTSVVAAFEAILATATDDYRSATGSEFRFFSEDTSPAAEPESLVA